MTYTAEKVLQVMPSVLDREGFDTRGGRHTSRGTEDEISGGSDPLSSMDPVCEVIDIERALARVPPDVASIAEDTARLSPWELREKYGEGWRRIAFVAVSAVARSANGFP